MAVSTFHPEAAIDKGVLVITVISLQAGRPMSWDMQMSGDTRQRRSSAREHSRMHVRITTPALSLTCVLITLREKSITYMWSSC